MARTDTDYLEELTVHLRLSGMTGEQIGAVLEEARDHLASSGQAPEDAFGSAEDYAAALIGAHPPATSARGMHLTRGDLVAGAAQMVGWLLLVFGVFAVAGQDGVEVQPGHVAGLAVLTVGLLWPVWPAMRAFVARRISFVVPILAMSVVVGAFVTLSVVWDAPVLLTLPAWPAVLFGVAVIVGCWLRAWRLRDPIRRPEPGERASDRHPG